MTIDDETGALGALIDKLRDLRQELTAAEAASAAALALVHPAQAGSARNLVHFLALRRHDLRALQAQLADLGLSSLGRAEPHVLTTLDRVDQVLHALAGRRYSAPTCTPATTARRRSGDGLRQRADALFGAPPFGRQVRIMVTLPRSAADDDGLLRGLIAAGMDVARINAAHDDPQTWERLALKVRSLSAALGRATKVLMDLPGPKLRTGPLPDEAPVLRLKPVRDAYGQVLEPACLHLRSDAAGPTATSSGTVPTLTGAKDWLAALAPDMAVHTVDARGRKRTLRVQRHSPDHAILTCDKSVYVVADTAFRAAHLSTSLGQLPRRPGRLMLARGDRLELRRGDAAATQRLSIPCTLPEVFTQVNAGDHVAFDDGRIHGVVRRAGTDRLDIEISATRLDKETLEADRGINLPMSTLDVPVPTAHDLRALDVAVRVADMVALSFAQRPADVQALHAALEQRQAADLPVLLKIETRLGFENLPALMMAAMARPVAGVMIARGDLAVELGWQRLAEVQEEILWAAEAAHLPVVWATQVLDAMARSGQPSRAEITDAAMSVRAEAVMLNKGPHVVEAVRLLDDILRRMQEHQHKKRTMLRALHAWQRPAEGASPSVSVAPAGVKATTIG